MENLLAKVAPSCLREEGDEEDCGSDLPHHPVLSFAGALAITGIGMVTAVGGATILVAVPVYLLTELF